MPNFQIIDARAEKLAKSQLQALRGVLGNGPTGTDPEATKELTGRALIFLTEQLSYTAAQAWRIVRPSSDVSDTVAAVNTRRFKRWHREKYPPGILEVFAEEGVTMKYLVRVLRAGTEAVKLRWDNDKSRFIETDLPDHNVRRQTVMALLKVAELDRKTRQELAIGAAETKKMHLNTGMKFDTIEAWTEWMEGQDEKLLEERARAAKEMKLIAAGHQIIQKEGEEAAKKMKQAALDAGLTGDEDDD